MFEGKPASRKTQRIALWGLLALTIGMCTVGKHFRDESLEVAGAVMCVGTLVALPIGLRVSRSTIKPDYTEDPLTNEEIDRMLGDCPERADSQRAKQSA
jgi:hypothetical protein